ncbi:MAG: ABC transporter substrate-binding protein [Hyphomicrobiales bacterium]|nr:ABC transporter substrate-binding protein [Hyphomicrobiales bacterium]
MRLTRRALVHTGALSALAPLLHRLGVVAPAAHAQGAGGEPQWRHGLSLFGELKYPPGFKHFEYVNPSAPKGGSVRMVAFGTFDNFNEVVAGMKGSIAAAVGMTSDSLLVSALDEVSTEYGLIAETVSHPADFSAATFRLRQGARHHDGKPITVEDVIFSMEAFKKHNPSMAAYYRHVVKMEQTGERDVRFVLDGPGNREMPVILGQLSVLAKHWWDGTDSSGKKRDVGATTLEPPLGNGAYRIKEFVAGRTVVVERVKDYWGKDLNVNIGRDNFDELRFEYFRDSTVAIEAFKADHIDWRTENSAKNWATAYDFPATRDKRVILEEFPQRNRGIMQGFAFNIRRERFRDPRLRLAFNYAYDFEEMNKQIFFGQYRRITSYFDGTELASSGLPQGQELAILETVRDKVPPEVFTTPYVPPVSGSPEKVRANLREATRLLREAGYEVRNQKLVNAKSGETFAVEILSSDPASERFILFYKPSLERLGITVNVRTVDDPQYENRLRNWDFDMIIAAWPESLSPGNEQRDFWSSQSADTPGSRNYVGIKNPAVDALIDRVIFAKDRAELIAATRALDRVLLWNHYVVPQFTYDKQRTARWDRFSRPDPLPEYAGAAFPTVWWWDPAKAAKTGSRQ